MSWGTGRSGRLVVAALGAVVASAPGCTKEKLVQGECRPLNGADVCSWGTMSGNTLVAFGATIPMRAIENAPAEMPMAWPPKVAAVIPLPAEVKSGTGFDNITLYWEPHGHPPGPYLTPHFDFHFNTMDVTKIDCADSTKPAQIPVDYELPDVTIPQLGTLLGLCVPGMGMHSLPATELHSTALFQKTMIVGYYHQQPIFVEPMITRATLMERRSFQFDVPAVPGVAASVHYPTKFRADFDSTAQAYKFVFTEFGGAGGAK
jgi:hypothetical protein